MMSEGEAKLASDVITDARRDLELETGPDLASALRFFFHPASNLADLCAGLSLELDAVVERALLIVGRRIDESQPLGRRSPRSRAKREERVT